MNADEIGKLPTPKIDKCLTHNIGYANYQLDSVVPIARKQEQAIAALVDYVDDRCND